MASFPGASDVRPKSAQKSLRSRPSETAMIPGEAKRISITDKSTEARPSSAQKSLHSKP